MTMITVNNFTVIILTYSQVIYKIIIHLEPPKMGGKEKRVFVNYYTTDDISDGTRSNNPIWNCFLREENGRSALCKICDEQGVQRILKLKNSGTFCLHRHLKLMHDIVLETSQYKDRDEQQIRDLADVRVVSTSNHFISH